MSELPRYVCKHGREIQGLNISGYFDLNKQEQVVVGSERQCPECLKEYSDKILTAMLLTEP